MTMALAAEMDKAVVVREPPPRRDRVYFGAVVTVQDHAGETTVYRIVGADETEAARGWISVDSPLARALLGKPVDSRVTVDLPEGRAQYDLMKIEYF